MKGFNQYASNLVKHLKEPSTTKDPATENDDSYDVPSGFFTFEDLIGKLMSKGQHDKFRQKFKKDLQKSI